MSGMTSERREELRRIAEAATPGPWISPWHLECENAEEYGFYAANGEKVVGLFWFDGYHLECSEENARHIATFDPTTALSLLDEIERLRRERERLADLLRQVDVVMDGAAMDGVKSILAPQYQDDWALVHTRVREQIALFDGEKGGGGE